MEPISEKRAPAYAIASVDHALRLAAALQLEGRMTPADAAERLGVARSTAHRLLQMLVYRDFARQDDGRVYRPGLVLELAEHSPSRTGHLRRVSLPHLQRLRDAFDELASLSIRTGDTTRFIASVESRRTLRTTSREGMVYPLYATTTGMLHLATLSDDELGEYIDRNCDASSRRTVLQDVDRVRRSGFALNLQRSELGLIAVGTAIRSHSGELLAGLAVSMSSVRYQSRQLASIVATLRSIGADIEADYYAWSRESEPRGKSVSADTVGDPDELPAETAAGG